MNWDFWHGAIIFTCYRGMIQDYMGKDKYLELADLTWVDTKWWYWILIYLAFGLVSLLNAVLEKKREQYESK